MLMKFGPDSMKPIMSKKKSQGIFDIQSPEYMTRVAKTRLDNKTYASAKCGRTGCLVK